MWKYKGEAMGVEGIIGVPNRDMDDDEFVEASAKMDLQFPDQKGSLEKCGLWEHVRDTATRSSPPIEPAPELEPAKDESGDK